MASSMMKYPDNSQSKFWPRELVLGLMPLLVGFQLLVWIVYLPISMKGGADFTSLYASAYMARTHHGTEIHDDVKLLEFKQKVTPGKHVPMPMDHLAYEVLLYAPFSFLPYRSALILFILINLVLVGVCSGLLSSSFRVLREMWKPLPTLLFAAFFPISRAILQGQDSVILLFLFVVAFLYLNTGKEDVAGMIIGLGMFKLQIVIPVAIMFLLWRRWHFVRGFAASFVGTLAITLLIVGIGGMRQYASTLLGMSFRLKTNEDAMRYLLSPRTMLNIRGLATALLEGHLPHWWVQGIIVAVSLLLLLVAARFRPSLPLAILVSSLVSYHLNAQDASILLIPVGLALCSNSKWLALIATLVLITPITAMAPLYGYTSAIPVLLLFGAFLREAGKEATVEEALVPA